MRAVRQARCAPSCRNHPPTPRPRVKSSRLYRQVTRDLLPSEYIGTRCKPLIHAPFLHAPIAPRNRRFVARLLLAQAERRRRNAESPATFVSAVFLIWSQGLKAQRRVKSTAFNRGNIPLQLVFRPGLQPLETCRSPICQCTYMCHSRWKSGLRHQFSSGQATLRAAYVHDTMRIWPWDRQVVSFQRQPTSPQQRSRSVSGGSL